MTTRRQKCRGQVSGSDPSYRRIYLVAVSVTVTVSVAVSVTVSVAVAVSVTASGHCRPANGPLQPAAVRSPPPPPPGRPP